MRPWALAILHKFSSLTSYRADPHSGTGSETPGGSCIRQYSYSACCPCARVECSDRSVRGQPTDADAWRGPRNLSELLGRTCPSDSVFERPRSRWIPTATTKPRTKLDYAWKLFLITRQSSSKAARRWASTPSLRIGS